MWTAAAAHRTPLVTLHGGPGAPSRYLYRLEALAVERPVIFYDQLFGGRSNYSESAPHAMMHVADFPARLELLRTHMQVESWHVLGHSWGTNLAMEYYLLHPGLRCPRCSALLCVALRCSALPRVAPQPRSPAAQHPHRCPHGRTPPVSRP